MNKRPLIVSLLLAALCLPVLRASEPADPSAHYVGMNLWFLNDWDGSNAFANIMMHAREWRNAAWNATAASDPEGWPTQDASTVIFGTDNQLGTYKLVFEGQAETISFLFGVNISGSITNKVYNAATNTTTADVNVVSHTGSAAGLVLTGTRRTAASALNTGFRNLRLYRPGHAADGSELFDQRFLALMAPFQVIRFMDWVDANNNGEISWANRWRPGMARRPTYTAAGRSGMRHGIPLETMVALSNQLGADLWLNLPTLADDDYLQKTALTLLYGSDGTNPYTSPQANPVWPPLNPGLKVYLEYSNEIWNSAPGFNAFYWIRDIADAIIANPAPHPAKLNLATGAYDEINRETVMARYTAWRGVAISEVFRGVFGDAAMQTRIRPILAGQLGGNWSNPRQLPWLEAFYGNIRPGTDPFPNSSPRPVTDFFYGAGGSTYHEVITHSTDPDIFFAPDNYPQPDWLVRQGSDATLARNYGLRRIAYEGGVQTLRFGLGDNPPATNEEKLALQADPRMKTVVEVHHDAYTASGGDLLVYYVNTSALDWQFTPNVWNLDTPKLDAIDSILNERSRVPVTHGQEVPGTLVARTQYDAGTADRVGTFFTTTLSGLDVVGGIDPGESLGLATNTRSPGRYRVRLSAATSGTASVRLHVNGAAAGEVTLVGAGISVLSDSTTLDLILPEEFNVVRVSPLAGSLRLHRLEFEYLGLAINTPSPLPVASRGLPYAVDLSGSGGTAPRVWSIDSGSLPGGLALDSATGRISGTPVVDGDFSFTLRFSDSSTPPEFITRDFQLVVNPPETDPPVVVISSPAHLSAQGPGFAVTGTATDLSGVAWVQYRIDGGAWQNASGTSTWSASLSNLAHGERLFEVRAAEAAHPDRISEPLARSFLVDAQAPLISGLGVAPTQVSAVVGFQTDEPAYVRVRLGTTSGIYPIDTGLSDILATAHSIELDGLTPSTSYVYRVEVIDPHGNATQSGEGSFSTLDLGPAQAAPGFGTPAGSYVGPITITLDTASPGASIRYTTDGSEPGSAAGLLYTGPFALNSSATLRAIATRPGYVDSPVSSAVYTLSGGGGSAGEYQALNSTQPGGPAFLWHDTSTAAGGTRIWGPTNVDDTNVALSFPAGFSFPFYGSTYNSIRVCSNGFLSLSSTSNAYNNTALPSASAPQALIAPYWTDLYLVANSSSVTWRRIDDDTLAITYDKARRYSSRSDSTLYITFQAVLHRDGKILLNYQDNLYDNSLYTLGIQNQDRSEAVQVSYNNSYLPAGTAVNFAVQIAQGSNAAAAPSASVAPGSYTPPLSLELMTATPDAVIRYTLDGSIPTAGTGLLYTGAIPLSDPGPLTLHALASADGMDPSEVIRFDYTLMGISTDPPVVDTATLPAAVYGEPYAVQLAHSGGEGEVTWSLRGGDLPHGLVLTPDGRITGTPINDSATFSPTFEARDTFGGNGTRMLSLQILPVRGATLVIPPTTGTVVLDGALGESFWTLPHQALRRLSGPDDSTLHFQLRHDADGLILAARISDASSNPADALHLFLDARHLVIRRDGTWEERNSQSQGIQAFVTAIAGGYELEVRIPYSNLGLSPEGRSVALGFDLALEDAAASPGWLLWQGVNPADPSPATFARLVLAVDSVSGNILVNGDFESGGILGIAYPGQATTALAGQGWYSSPVTTRPFGRVDSLGYGFPTNAVQSAGTPANGNIYQVIHDARATQGPGLLRFDVKWASPDTAVRLFGYNGSDATVDANIGVRTQQHPAQGGTPTATLLASTLGHLPASATWREVALPVDFGSGYDYLILSFSSLPDVVHIDARIDNIRLGLLGGVSIPAPPPAYDYAAWSAHPAATGTLLDYALGGSSPPTATLVPGEFRLLYPRARADILYQVEAATQLNPADWSPLPVLQDSDTPVGGTATGRLLLDPGSDLRFLRLRATLQENTP